MAKLILLLTLLLSGSHVFAQDSMTDLIDLYTTFPKWRDVVTQRLGQTWKLYSQEQTERLRLRQVLIDRIGLTRREAASWTHLTRQVSLEQGSKVAQYFGLETSWLLAFDVLKREFGEKDQFLKKNTRELFGTYRGFTNFKEIIVAALNTELPRQTKCAAVVTSEEKAVGEPQMLR